MTYDFENTVALVTGAGSGIGRATAKRFAADGATVVVADIDTKAGQETANQIEEDKDGEATFMEVDTSRSESVSALVGATLNKHGRLDYAVNNAAIGNTPAQVPEIDEDEWNRVLDVNQTGVWVGMKYELPAMYDSGGGAIVNVSSKAGIRGSPGRAPYAASKHGVVGLTRTAALETAARDVRVNAVCPTIVETTALESMSESERSSIIDEVPMKRAASPDEVASAIVWLCSDEASYITGHSLPVDGGETQK
ncbi:SDR family NAD(P)-dependent oxidoreductase [Halobacterium jilantaiense]|uniref:NAD(P)-dependent dehydrogenase, short-chain alcohol dehydrogenase family n=1 Tax=Halobacterium jilantaiense TaxID=355548 RepID=A0A1I0R2S9_9EURY|nr:glucose 1-dehydrogenase [Halobacterium jilantaiense]SEW34764.1 NAD(P)-dependent dehydrogenase, short-chain alcohol dehydrogenase family [Halobacterium jilantaiense]